MGGTYHVVCIAVTLGRNDFGYFAKITVRASSCFFDTNTSHASKEEKSKLMEL